MVAEQLAQSVLWILGFVTVVAEFERTLDVALLVVVAGAITSATPRHKTLSQNIEVRTVYISHGECGGHHHSVSTKPLSMSARNSDAHFSGRVGASARFSSEGTRHARSSAA